MCQRLERAGIGQLPLDLLQRHDLCGTPCGHREDLAQQGRPPNLTECEHVATDRRVDDGVTDVRAPSYLIVCECPCPPTVRLGVPRLLAECGTPSRTVGGHGHSQTIRYD